MAGSWSTWWRHGPVLSLTLSDQLVQCAQVRRAGRQEVVQRVAVWPLPEGGWSNDPAQLGAGLRQFLRARHFSASRVVLGAPAKWLVSHEKDLPPADGTQAAALLRLHTERLAAADHTAMTFDAVGALEGSNPRKVLLVGMLEPQVQRLRAVCVAAGLTPIALTATSLALAQRLNTPATAVLLSMPGAEVVGRRDGRLSALRHLSLVMPVTGELAPLAGEIRRTLSLSGSSGAGELVCLRSSGWTESQAAELAQRAGLGGPRTPELADVGLRASSGASNGEVDAVSPNQTLSAAAVGAMALRGRLPVNLWRSRLAPAPVRRVGRRAVWAAVLALLGIGALASLYLNVLQREAEVVELDERLRQLTPDLKAAQAAIDAVAAGRSYYEQRPPMLDCMRDVTLAIERNDPLWVTSFAWRDNLRGQVQGKATDQRTVLAVLDRLRNHAHFTQVQLADLRDAPGQTRQVTFNITFTYAPGGQP